MRILYVENRDGWKGDRDGNNGQGCSTLKADFQYRVPQSVALTM